MNEPCPSRYGSLPSHKTKELGMAFRHMPRSIVVLGFVSMFMDISSEMIHSLLPVFMVSVLGVSAFAVGIIEGVAEATASIVKVFSGVISDWIGRRKPLVLLGQLPIYIMVK